MPLFFVWDILVNCQKGVDEDVEQTKKIDFQKGAAR